MARAKRGRIAIERSFSGDLSGVYSCLETL